ncbi:Transcription factor fungi [Macrophomina phaseolina MS6]|uniref:Transcription factor fungi n=1 Tax=Macrophomina phaseolina (strain MS6) TaxID=1126212 RepID=K2RN26_MACPH|nr:Transcription factor fungi [Macrophomina phaseolina MS6]
MTQPSKGPSSPECIAKSQVPLFAGETSVAHTLSQVEDRLGAFGVSYPDDVSPLQEDTNDSIPCGTRFDSRKPPKNGFIRQVLLSNEIAVDRARWDNSMDIFFEEVHILYPMLHVPDVKAFYAQMWEDWFLLPPGPASYRYRVRVAQVFLCLATGTCTGSTRVSVEDGKHAAGWSLYRAAMEMIGDLFEICESDSPMEALQTLALLVIYLFRLDALERGEKVMSLAVSYAHQLGIHRQKVLDRMPFFDDEMYRRVWWCVYILDRRYALEAGRPFLTQDYNVDAPSPRNISDDWMELHKEDPRTSREMSEDIQHHLSCSQRTPIPYLFTMANYSRIVGKVWEALYGARETESVPGFFLNEYLETLLSKFESDLPPEFQYTANGTFETQFENMPWWQIKQKMLLRMRTASLRLLIRKPLLQQAPSAPTQEQNYVGNEVMCIQLAHSIISQFSQIPDDYPKFMFPFIHYLLNATIISFALIIKEPLFRRTYGAPTILAAHTLRNYCTKTWVSGKLVRTVLRLNHMINAVLGEEISVLSEPNTNTRNSKGNAQFCDNATDPALEQTFPYLEQTESFATPAVPHPAHSSTLDWQQEATSTIGSASTVPTARRSSANTATSPDLTDLVMADYDFEEMLHRAVNGAASSRVETSNEIGSKDPSKDVFNTEWFNALFGGRLDSDQLAII